VYEIETDMHRKFSEVFLSVRLLVVGNWIECIGNPDNYLLREGSVII
jgi:hypothetical protein